MRLPVFTISAFALLVCLSFSSTLQAEGPNPEKEKELIALLRSEAPAAEKALACKHLAVHGTANAVPDLARLLENPQLSSWARIALEVIPGPEADAALRQATNSITGLLLVGTLNSIGVRRDAAAVDLLIARLNDPDAEVASAAAVALGRIGNAAAAKGLSPLLATAPADVRPAIAEGMILCAEHAIAAKKSDDAVALYDQVRKADVHRQRTLEATRGAILARKPEAGIELLLTQLKSNDRGLFQIGLSTAREFPGNAIDKALASELKKSTPERAPFLINAMADRQETVVLSAIIETAVEGPKPVRLAAITALSKVGNDSCVTPLLQLGVDKDAELVNAARQALGELPGAKVNDAIVARLSNSQGPLYPFVINVIGQRRIVATAELKKALSNSDTKVRQAALVALGETIPQKDLGVLIAPFLSASDDDEAVVAEKALKTACVRMPDAEACASELIAVFAKADAPTQVVLLEILSAVGGKNALKTVAASAKSTDADLQDASSRLLGEWPTIDAAPVLYELITTAPDEKYKTRAFRGYVRIARQFIMPEPERIAMCHKILEAAKTPADKKLVFDIVKKFPSLDGLKIALTLNQEVPELKDEGTQVVMAITQKLGTKGPEVAELLAKGGLGKVKLEIVKAEYGAGATQKDVTGVLQKQAAEVQLVSLPMATYNESFGGDPAPGVVKQLRVQYKINGKDGSATFAENALIVLPMPK